MAGKQRGRRSHSAKCVYCKTRHGEGAPWWNESKDGWSITFKSAGKVRNKLLAKGWHGHDEAVKLWKKRFAEQAESGPLLLKDDGEDTTIQWLVVKRLSYLKATASAAYYENAKNWLKDFCESGFGDATIRDMRTGGIARIKQWVAQHSWNETTTESVYKTLKSMFNFATGNSEDGLDIIETSPIAKLNTGRTRVKGKSRVEFFTPEQETAILANADPRGIYPQFALAFKALMATGVRPEEFCIVTAADVRKDTNGDLYWWLKHKNIKKTRSKRRVYLTPEMQKITAEQMGQHPEGPIFRNCWGQPWDVDSLYQALRRVTTRKECAALGLHDCEIGARTNGKPKKEFRYVVYTCRHTFAHRYLTGYHKKPDGTPIVLTYGELAELMGNSAAEVEKTYGHLAKATTYLSGLVKHA